MKKKVQPKDYSGLDLLKYKQDVCSQNGENGIITKILRLLNKTDSGWCCDVGAWDGKTFSNVFNLIEFLDWKGVLIEESGDKFIGLQREADRLSGRVIAINITVHYLEGMHILDDILATTPIPENFDILNIDVDGPDYHIWKSLTVYRPKIVIIEHSGLIGEYVQQAGAPHKYHDYGSTSFTSMFRLGREKGYRLLVDTGNLIFLVEELAEKIC